MKANGIEGLWFLERYPSHEHYILEFDYLLNVRKTCKNDNVEKRRRRMIMLYRGRNRAKLTNNKPCPDNAALRVISSMASRNPS